MTFKKVDKVPEYTRKHYHKLGEYLEEFMRANIKAAKVELVEGEYRSLKAAYNALHKATSRWAVPIDVVKRGDEIFLVRRDI